MLRLNCHTWHAEVITPGLPLRQRTWNGSGMLADDSVPSMGSRGIKECGDAEKSMDAAEDGNSPSTAALKQSKQLGSLQGTSNAVKSIFKVRAQP